MNAPHYIAIYSEEKEGYLLNAGYILQQLDLYLSKEGIGTLWLGLGKPQESLKAKNGLLYVITLAVGKAKKKLQRKSSAECKRKAGTVHLILGAKHLLRDLFLLRSFEPTTDFILFSR
ncbi:nitroreductase family protein [Isachenkonia alkalipeptolytica]|uniref:nitroreductase family protein n=1 Tax=Isachenkonia alkalipeptolytica TaxID=2565777 RepID=UPI00352CE7CA